MSPQERSAAAFFLFIFAGYLFWGALARSGDWDGEQETKWCMRGAGVFALGAIGMLIWAASS